MGSVSKTKEEAPLQLRSIVHILEAILGRLENMEHMMAAQNKGVIHPRQPLDTLTREPCPNPEDGCQEKRVEKNRQPERLDEIPDFSIGMVSGFGVSDEKQKTEPPKPK